MNFLELVQKTVRRSGAKVEVPTTVVGQTGIAELFVEWVAEAWKEIQLERLGSFFRRSRDLTFDTAAGTDEYGIGSGLESVNTRSLTVNESGENETYMCFYPYDYWRTQYDRVTQSSGKPLYFTIDPSNETFIFWPVPDDIYTIRYEGILDVQEFDATDGAGVGTSDALEPIGLNARYHDAIVWQAIMSYAMHFEDGTKLSEGQAKFKPYKKYFEARYMDIPTVDTTAMYNRGYR